MESEDRDGEEAEKPTVITFDPSLPTSHAVSLTASITRFMDRTGLDWCLQSLRGLTCASSSPVPGLGHGGVPRPHGARRRQLPDHPGAATHGRDAGAGPDAAAAALPAAGGQHDAQRHPERPNLRCAALVRGDRLHTHCTEVTSESPVFDRRSTGRLIPVSAVKVLPLREQGNGDMQMSCQ